MINLYSATVALMRVYAAYLAITSAIAAASTFSLIGKYAPADPSSRALLTTEGLQRLLVLVIALLVWRFARRLAAYVTRDLGDQPIHLDSTGVFSLQVAAFSLLGMYLLVYATPGLIKIIASYAFPTYNRQHDITIFRGAPKANIPLPDVLQLVSQLAIGIWLLVGSKGIVSAVAAAWSKARPKQEG